MLSGSARKRKGSAFERDICKRLSLWVSAGKKTDCFWRSAMSGGRATVSAAVRQCGDICAVAPEGNPLADFFYFECKHNRDLQIIGWLLSGTGKLPEFWRTAEKQASDHGRRPLLIFRQNQFPIMFIHPRQNRDLGIMPVATVGYVDLVDLYRLDHWLATSYVDQPWLRRKSK